MRLVASIALLAATLACGNYGPPVRTRIAQDADAPQVTAPDDAAAAEECDEDEAKKQAPER